MTQNRLLTSAQVAASLQISEQTVIRWLRQGQLRGFRLGAKWWVSATEFNAFLEARANLPPVRRTSAGASGQPPR